MANNREAHFGFTGVCGNALRGAATAESMHGSCEGVK